MGKHTRQISRNKSKQKEKNAEKDLSEKVKMFDRLPNECGSCEKPFDKKNKKLVSSWFVVVKEKEQRVNLYCPPCWNQAQDILTEFRKKVEQSLNDNKDNG